MSSSVGCVPSVPRTVVSVLDSGACKTLIELRRFFEKRGPATLLVKNPLLTDVFNRLMLPSSLTFLIVRIFLFRARV